MSPVLVVLRLFKSQQTSDQVRSFQTSQASHVPELHGRLSRVDNFEDAFVSQLTA